MEKGEPMNPPPNNCPPLCGTHMDSEVDALKRQIGDLSTALLKASSALAAANARTDDATRLAIDAQGEVAKLQSDLASARAVIAAKDEALRRIKDMVCGEARDHGWNNLLCITQNRMTIADLADAALTPASGGNAARPAGKEGKL